MIKKIKSKYVSSKMIKDAINNKINFEMEHGDITYIFRGGMVVKIEDSKVSLLNKKCNAFKLCEELSL